MHEAEVGVIWETVASYSQEKKVIRKWLLIERTRNRSGITDPQYISIKGDPDAEEYLLEERSAGEGRNVARPDNGWKISSRPWARDRSCPLRRRCRLGFG